MRAELPRAVRPFAAIAADAEQRWQKHLGRGPRAWPSERWYAETILALVRDIWVALDHDASAESVAGLALNLGHWQTDAEWRFAQGPGIKRRKDVSAKNRESARLPREPRLTAEDAERIRELARQGLTDRQIAVRMARAEAGRTPTAKPTAKEIEKWRGRARLVKKKVGN